MIRENEEFSDLDGMLETMPTKFDTIGREERTWKWLTSTACKTNGIWVHGKHVMTRALAQTAVNIYIYIY